MNRFDAAPMATWERVRRPSGLVEQTRRLFFLAVLVSTALLLPGPLVVAPPVELRLMLVAAGVLIAVWSSRFFGRSAPVLLDVAEIAAIAALGAALPDPGMVLVMAVPALWFRASYGSTRPVGLFGVGMATGVAAVVLWPLTPGRSTVESLGVIATAAPVILLTTLVARHLCLGLFAREHAQERDAALVRLGRGLIGLTDRVDIFAAAHACTEEICAATPGLRVLVVMRRDTRRTVVGHMGPFAEPPEVLPAGLLPAGAGQDGDPPQPMPDNGRLDRAAGAACAWLAMPLVEDTDAWYVVGAPHRVPDEVVVALQSMAYGVTLAMRTSYAHHELATQATVDALTGVANRAAFTAALDVAMEVTDRRLALLFLDLDDFKIVNDGLGHAAGDELLREVASRLQRAVGPDDLCARLGGDEFAVLLSDPGDGAVAVAQRLVELVAAPVWLTGRLAQVGASVGVAFAGVGESTEQVVQHADIAMYAAKAKGKNRVQTFDPSLLQEDGRVAFETELAAAAGAGQLVVHYQPIVAVTGGRCLAVEALARWNHPERGLLGPAEFIPVAERTGAIIDIGRSVMRRACADVTAWRGSGDRLAVHVNVSGAQLTDPDFLDVVRSCIAEFGMEPKQLVLEITETMALDSDILSTLDRLITLGAAIAIDDFGTGYSALSIIRTLPLDIVKLDKSFIDGGPSSAADEAVVGAVVAMAGRLGLQVVAEGVERLEQQQFLCNVGVNAAQGFLYLHPTPAAQFERWLARNGTDQPQGNVASLDARRRG